MNRLIHRSGYALTRTFREDIGASESLAQAQRADLTMTDYIESLWAGHGSTMRILAGLEAAGALSHAQRVCEIGPGNGRFTERVLETVAPSIYEVYEPADDWASYLRRQLGVRTRFSDGRTLASTADGSCGLVHANGVFYVIPAMVSFRYFNEMMRVASSDGVIAFDIFAADLFKGQSLLTWIASGDRYPVVLDHTSVESFFQEGGWTLASHFDHPVGNGQARYLVFRSAPKAP